MTGSAVPILDTMVTHSGTGRIFRIRMRPMSLFESLESNGEVRLTDLFSGKSSIEAISTIKLEELASLIVRGG